MSKLHIQREVFRTPAWITESLVDKFPQWFYGKLLDPSAGDGRMAVHLLEKKLIKSARLIDIRKEEVKVWKKLKYPNLTYRVGDFLQLTPKSTYDVILSNPPFSITDKFIEHSWQWLKPGGRMLYLQRVNWLGSLKRRTFFVDNSLVDLVIIGKRPTWEIDGRKNNSDTYEYGWFCFAKPGAPRLHWMYPK